MMTRTRFQPTRLAGCAIIVLAQVAASMAAAPPTPAPMEKVGPIPPSIHVPPVRTSPPARTHPIERPPQYDENVRAEKQGLAYRMESLRLAIDNLAATFGDRYPQGCEFLERWEQLSRAIAHGESDVEARFTRHF